MFEENFDLYLLLARRLKALADPTRLGIVHTLCRGESNVNGLVKMSGFSQARISRHLRILREEKLVNSRRERQNVYYSLSSDFPRRICEMVFESLECSSRDDLKILEQHDIAF